MLPEVGVVDNEPAAVTLPSGWPLGAVPSARYECRDSIVCDDITTVALSSATICMLRAVAGGRVRGRGAERQRHAVRHVALLSLQAGAMWDAK